MMDLARMRRLLSPDISFDQVWAELNDPNNWPVYVHCKGGRHRTGALTAVYRITHDNWTADKAWEEMKEFEFNHGLFGGPKAQKKFVYAYYEQYTRAAQK